MKVDVVIGSSLGDEGKGLVTDWLVRTGGEPLVVRFNGGAQAGHTVDRDGVRHTFHHFGSGTLQGAATYLSRYFIVNPFMYFKEQRELIAKRVKLPIVYVDEWAPVTTLYDMALNQIIESRREGGRHGSCGIGINETVTRNANRYFELTLCDCVEQSQAWLVRRLSDIAERYVPLRLKQLGIDEWSLDQIERDMLFSHNNIDVFVATIREFLANVVVVDGNDAVDLLNGTRYDHVIFEGAQGLLLDEYHPWFPHVTRSRTGLPNVRQVMSMKGDKIPKPDVYYVTRSYLTRHGRGPLPNEVDGPIFTKIVDNTNVPNEFQESLRFAPINPVLLLDTISNDLRGEPVHAAHLVITCIDQIDDLHKVPVATGGLVPAVVDLSFGQLVQGLEAGPFFSVYGSYDPHGNLQAL